MLLKNSKLKYMKSFYSKIINNIFFLFSQKFYFKLFVRIKIETQM